MTISLPIRSFQPRRLRSGRRPGGRLRGQWLRRGAAWPASIMDERLHAHPSGGGAAGDHESENYFFDGAPVPSDERVYDDPPRARATNSLVTVAVLIGCGILGTAGAYGYRTYHSGTGATDAPIISADKTPNKVVPAAAGGDQQGKSVRAGRRRERAGRARARKSRSRCPIRAVQRGVLPAPFTTSPGPGPSVQSNAAPQSAPGGHRAQEGPHRAHSAGRHRPDGAAGDRHGDGATICAVTAGRHHPPTSRLPSRRPAPARNGGGPLSLEPQAGDTLRRQSAGAPCRGGRTQARLGRACSLRRWSAGRLCGANLLAAKRS